MDLQNPPRSGQIALTRWKAKVYDVMRRMDKLASGKNGKTRELGNDL